MKTIKIACLSVIASFILLTACSKDEFDAVPTNNQDQSLTQTDYKTTKPGIPEAFNKGWREDFASPASLTARFNLYGTPLPQWVAFACKRPGLFDNNGTLPGGSYAVSKLRVGNGYGYVIESDVYIDVAEPKGAIICPEIGVTSTLNPPTELNNIERGISMKLMYLGEGVAGVPAAFQKQAFVQMSILTEDQGISSSTDPKVGNNPTPAEYAFKLETANSGWHTMKIIVSPSRKVYFYLDNRFVWSPEKQVNLSMMRNKNIFLGYLSPGTSGKAYHDFVKVSYPKFREINNTTAQVVIAE